MRVVEEENCVLSEPGTEKVAIGQHLVAGEKLQSFESQNLKNPFQTVKQCIGDQTNPIKKKH
jgi:hypothetical protein